MKTSRGSSCGIAAVVAGALAVAVPGQLVAQQTDAPSGLLGDSDLGGVVTSANGPEAGVWVIAETADLPTKFARLVVTDDRGRYLIPGLPKAKYTVWVRGYGLVDSAKVQAEPGRNIIQRSIGIHCSRSRTRICSPVPAPTACRSS
jgi:hypothetical protein